MDFESPKLEKSEREIEAAMGSKVSRIFLEVLEVEVNENENEQSRLNRL